MKHPEIRPVLAFLVLAAVACSDAPVAPSLDVHPAFAKGGGGGASGGGGNTFLPAEFTFATQGVDLTGDGKGGYRHDVCGVFASWADIAYLSPAGSSIPRSQKAACADVAPRRVTLTLGIRHVSDDPHVDETGSPSGSGTFDVQNVKLGRLDPLDHSATGVVNVPGKCIVGTGKKASWVGMRFNAANYPGSSDLLKENLGNGTWRFYTRPYPENLAHCGEGGEVGLWHVNLDVTVATGG